MLVATDPIEVFLLMRRWSARAIAVPVIAVAVSTGRVRLISVLVSVVCASGSVASWRVTSGFVPITWAVVIVPVGQFVDGFGGAFVLRSQRL